MTSASYASNYYVNILVNGRLATKYNHDGTVYIEGRKGSIYELELVNNTAVQAEFVVSIDGLSIIDGKAAGRESTGYIVNAWCTSRIKGWLLDNKKAATFKFGSKGASYANHSEQGDIANAGVIGLQVFSKKFVQPTIYHGLSWPYDYGEFVNNDIKHMWHEPHITFGDRSRNLRSTYSGGAMGSSSIKGMSASPTASMNSVQLNQHVVQASNAAVPETSLGTEFGKATEFSTHSVAFERASTTPAYQTAIYYGDASDLNRLGIVLDWQKKPVSHPNPFPADNGYCVPPKNWSK